MLGTQSAFLIKSISHYIIHYTRLVNILKKFQTVCWYIYNSIWYILSCLYWCICSKKMEIYEWHQRQFSNEDAYITIYIIQVLWIFNKHLTNCPPALCSTRLNLTTISICFICCRIYYPNILYILPCCWDVNVHTYNYLQFIIHKQAVHHCAPAQLLYNIIQY